MLRRRRQRSFLLGCLAALLAGCVSQPLEPWHSVQLTEEFDRGKREDVATFDAYLALEDRLFDELRREIYAEVGTGTGFALVRYSAGSAADPDTREPDFNRSFELTAESPRGGVLLLHGMADSPYTLRHIGASLNAHGYWVIGLRLPGHGTAPSGLTRVRWEDMAAAARIAMERIADRVGERPIHIVGYSTGAALALDASLEALDAADRRMPTSLVLISPAIGATRAAALAGTKAAIGRLPGLGSAAFTQIGPEFDPYRYNSFATNAGSQVDRLTRHVANRIARLDGTADAERLPPILVFKSTSDAMVTTDAVVDSLLGRLPDNGNKLVLFDINRAAVESTLLIDDPGPMTDRLMRNDALPFGIWLIGNEAPDTRRVVARYKPPLAGDAATTVDLGLEWPAGVISLSHVALPFPPDDELYGAERPDDPGRLYLGTAQIRGESGLLRIPGDWLLRLRYNPFYAVLEAQLIEWLDTAEPAR